MQTKTARELATDARIAGLKRRVEMIAANDASVVDGVGRFRDLPSPVEKDRYAEVIRVLAEGTAEDLAALGFPGGVARGRRNLRLALYGQLPKKDVPYGVIAANERHQSRMKIQGKGGQAGRTINLNMINIPAPVPTGPNDRVVIVQREKE